MKTTTIQLSMMLAAAMALSHSHSAHAAIDKSTNLQPIRFQTAQLISKKERVGGQEINLVEVRATAEFSNSCEAANVQVKNIESATDGDARVYRVIGTQARVQCPMVYMPVERTFVIDQITLEDDALPQIRINGIEAVAAHE